MPLPIAGHHTCSRRKAIRSSTVHSFTRLQTWTSRCCPMRCALRKTQTNAAACTTGGFSSPRVRAGSAALRVHVDAPVLSFEKKEQTRDDQLSPESRLLAGARAGGRCRGTPWWTPHRRNGKIKERGKIRHVGAQVAVEPTVPQLLFASPACAFPYHSR